jgi:hypothetical protein
MSSPLHDQNTVCLWLLNDAVDSATASDKEGNASLSGLQTVAANVGAHIASGGPLRNCLSWITSGVFTAGSPYVTGTISDVPTVGGAVEGDWTFDCFVKLDGAQYAGSALSEYEFFRVYSGQVTPTVTDRLYLLITFVAASPGGVPNSIKVYQTTDGGTYTLFLTAPYTPANAWDAISIRRSVRPPGDNWTYELFVNGVSVGSNNISTDVYRFAVALTTNYVRFQCPAKAAYARISKVYRTDQEITDFHNQNFHYSGARNLPYIQVHHNGPGVQGSSMAPWRNFRTQQYFQVQRTGLKQATTVGWGRNFRTQQYFEILCYAPALRGYLASNPLTGVAVDDSQLVTEFASPITLGMVTPSNLGYRVRANAPSQTIRTSVKFPLTVSPIRRKFFGGFDTH